MVTNNWLIIVIVVGFLAGLAGLCKREFHQPTVAEGGFMYFCYLMFRNFPK